MIMKIRVQAHFPFLQKRGLYSLKKGIPGEQSRLLKSGCEFFSEKKMSSRDVFSFVGQGPAGKPAS
jgi:hypothetical protein